jgi:poly(A) polymerase
MSKPKIEKQRMATINEVYNRIIWDPNLNRNTFVAGFHERVADEIREKPLAQWDDNSDIPWHRVRYIRCGETIVWDREQRIDLVSTNQLPAIAWKADPDRASDTDLAALIANNRVDFSPRSIYHYSDNQWRAYTGKLPAIDSPEDLTIVSYNILSDLHDADKIHTDLRLPVIVDELAKTQADIIALQEVTPRSLAYILATDWVQDYYISEAPNGNNIKPYGNLVMSRWGFDLVEYQFSGHKRVLIGKWQIDDRDIHVANVHLTSERGDNALQKRTQQLATVIGYLQAQTGDRFIVGDFNTRGDEQNQLFEYGNFIDLWTHLYPDRDGYTFDPTVNSLAMLMSLEGRPGRLDRILWSTVRGASALPNRNSTYRAVKMDLFGYKSFQVDDNTLYPADHFGICGVFKNDLNPSATIDRIDLTQIAPEYESILAIIPPEDLFPPIQAIRQQHDAGYVRIVPHITLLYGFLPDRYFDDVVDLIAPILAKMSPFAVTLTDFDVLTHHQSATAYLRLVVTPEEALHELQSTLNRLFPQCYEQSSKTAAGYNPHLSVGQFANAAAALATLPQWHPRKFTVDSVALLSRRRDEPCVIRNIVGIGKFLPKTLEHSELIAIVDRIEPEITEAQKQHRQTILDILQQACSECLGFNASLHLLGSARLEIGTPTSDLDVVCPIPNYLTGENFLTRVADCLQGLCDRSQIAIDAKIPILRLAIEGISIDLLYTQVEPVERWQNLSIDALKPYIKDPKSIVGCWEADLIIDRVKQNMTLDRFQLLLKAVRAWAKVRGIYGNSWGFLGGFSWSLLCAHICINYTDRDKSLEKLLASFFQQMSQHNWRKPIALTNAGNSYSVKLPQDLLPIVSSIVPCQNTARNITRSTLKILRDELARGAEISANVLVGKDSWTSLYAPANISANMDLALQISLIDTDKDALQQSVSAIESVAIGLIIQLEQRDLFVRPQPQIVSNENSNTLSLCLKLPANCDVNAIERLTRDFINRLHGIGITTQVELSIYRIDYRY